MNIVIPNTFDIFIADTGSDESEIKLIEDLITKFDNIKLIKYNYYNFAKINNDVVKNYIGDEYEYLLFCNNDIKILNDVIGGMLNTFKEKPKVGTIGIRLHYADNTIQHDGVVMFINNDKKLGVSHKNSGSYYSYSLGINKNFGNTAGLMMIRKFTFEKSGFFNENYDVCFEDVQLNATTLLLGLENYCDGNSVAYHYESQTREKDEETKNLETNDFLKKLLPFLIKNFNKLINKTEIYKF
jgi:GT2 family glycosyltransferase